MILVVPLGLLGVVAGRGAPRDGQQRLHADRHRADHRAGEQERDPDRRVRPRPALTRARRSVDAAVEAARLRFRPILMTSFAFILGVVPLVIADGAGAASRQSLGTAVFGGMIASTVLAVFFVPVFFVLFQSLSERWRRRRGRAAKRMLRRMRTQRRRSSPVAEFAKNSDPAAA